jgi:hypothetical protein
MVAEGVGEISMGWVHWTLIALCALGPVISASNVGKPRKVITSGDAAASAVLNIGLLLAVIFWG